MPKVFKSSIRLSAHQQAGVICQVDGQDCYASAEAVATAMKIALKMPTK